jgi:N-dimethylarginine dimethylaminohydrolase
MGYGPRSDAAAARVVEDMFGTEAIALELADPRFYHMDTALCPLPGGEVIHLPEAFTPPSLRAIRDRVAPDRRIEIARGDDVVPAQRRRRILPDAAARSALGDGDRGGYRGGVRATIESG